MSGRKATNLPHRRWGSFRKAGEGAALQAASGSAAAAVPRLWRGPTTTLRAVPLPICDGEDQK